MESWQIRYHGLSTIGLRKQSHCIQPDAQQYKSYTIVMSEFASQCLGSYVAVIHFQK